MFYSGLGASSDKNVLGMTACFFPQYVGMIYRSLSHSIYLQSLVQTVIKKRKPVSHREKHPGASVLLLRDTKPWEQIFVFIKENLTYYKTKDKIPNRGSLYISVQERKYIIIH